MIVYIGADHNGFHLRNTLIEYLKRAGYEVVDDGDTNFDANDDFPIFAAKVANHVLGSKDAEPRGIILCGSGQGVCMAANRHKGIRAALGYDRATTISARNDDNANVLCLPAHIFTAEQANLIAETFLNTPFANAPRFQRRLKEIDEL